MNRYVLGLIVLLSFGSNYIFASQGDCAEVRISYTYCNDAASRELGLVPMRLHEDVDNQLLTRTLNVHFFGTTRTVEQILDVVIDTFDLNEFAKFRLCAGSKEVSADHTFTLAELSSIGSLSIDCRSEDNTVDVIKNRRTKWIEDQLSGKGEQTAESWMKTRKVSVFVERNYFDELGKERSLRDLREIARKQRIIE